MEERSSKIVAIVALCVGVVGLSLGFAAFSNSVTISSSASVTPDSNTFNVVFDTDAGITCTPSGSASLTEGKTGKVEATTISEIDAAFTKPGDSVTCTATIKNAGQYQAFLKTITAGKVTCAAAANADGSTTTEALMDAACDTIAVTVTVDGTATATSTTEEEMNTFVTSHGLAAQTGTETVTLKIAYNGPEIADGKFTVSVPTVTLTYSSVDTAQGE